MNFLMEDILKAEIPVKMLILLLFSSQHYLQ